LDLAADPEKGMRRWLLVRRSTDDPEDRGYYQAYGPEGTPIEELVRVCQERWAVEMCRTHYPHKPRNVRLHAA
jgi:hypothetical protein